MLLSHCCCTLKHAHFTPSHSTSLSLNIASAYQTLILHTGSEEGSEEDEGESGEEEEEEKESDDEEGGEGESDEEDEGESEEDEGLQQQLQTQVGGVVLLDFLI